MQVNFLEKMLWLNRSLKQSNVEVAKDEDDLMKGTYNDRNYNE